MDANLAGRSMMARAVGAAVVVALLAAGAWLFFGAGGPLGGIAPSPVSGSSYTGPALAKEYRNAKLHFSVMMPEDFSAGELPADDSGVSSVILQNKNGDGIQIATRPYDDVHTLSASDIQAAIPDMKVESPESVNIGADYQGVAFRSDNDAFGGASREVWFVFRGALYQISTYGRLDGLLKAMFATWKFY